MTESTVNKGGRPSVMTAETIQKLEKAFLMGCPDKEACLYAEIAPSTLYAYQQENPEFTERKDTLKQNPFMKARGVILDALEDGDKFTAHKVIDRKEGSKLAIKAEIKPLEDLTDEELDARLEKLSREAGWVRPEDVGT